ncbi:MAG TPA: 3-oxoacyl-[acyl-carrier-protein] synthase III C-terminal domain-containing protein [Candidatus Limnocylindrales bacterium]
MADYGLSRPQTRMLRRLHGFSDLRVDPELPVLDLVSAPAGEVLRSVADRSTIKYLMFAHTTVTISPSYVHLPAAIAARFDLTEVETFTVSQQRCANSLSALDIAGNLLRADGDRSACVLLVTGEKRLASLAGLLGLSTAIGEASTACLISLDGSGDRVLSYADITRGQPEEPAWVSEAFINKIMERYTEDLTYVVGEALRRSGTHLRDIAMVVPHNVSRMLWYRTVEALGIERRRVFLDTVGQYGHCYCSDPFLNLMVMRERGQLVAGGRYLLVSVGLGATHAAVVIEHRPG